MLEVDQPFQIRLAPFTDTDGVHQGSFVRGVENEDQANISCAARNDEALKLGIKARYVVVANS